MKISTKIILFSSFIMALTVATLSWFQYQNVRDTLKAQSTNAIEESSDVLAQQITNWLSGKLAIIDSTAQIIDGDFSQNSIQHAFDVNVLKDNFILIFGGLDTDGKAITNDPSWKPKDWDARKRPWYNTAKKLKRATITEPYTDSKTKDILISVVANFTDKGVFKGAFGGDLSLKTVSEALNTVTFNGAGYTFLLSQDGKIISHPETKNNGKDYSDLFAGQHVELTTKIHEIKVNGESKWVSFTPLKGLGGMSWYIGVVVDADVVMAEANHIGTSSLIGVLISLVISILILSCFMKFLLKPIVLLTESLVDINSGHGDLRKRLPIISRDEFADVAFQFNLFVEHLQSLISDIKGLSDKTGASVNVVTKKSAQASKELVVQLSELDQLATAMNEMASSSHEVANSAQVAAKSATTADDETKHGVMIVSNVTKSIDYC